MCSHFSSLDLGQSGHIVLVSTGGVSVSLCICLAHWGKSILISMQNPYAELVVDSDMTDHRNTGGETWTDLEAKGSSFWFIL